jgi:hypothetical protein
MVIIAVLVNAIIVGLALGDRTIVATPTAAVALSILSTMTVVTYVIWRNDRRDLRPHKMTVFLALISLALSACVFLILRR